MEGIWIGIMSANNGAGSTALAIGLANYINQYDASVCYVEANESGDLAPWQSIMVSIRQRMNIM